MVSRKLSVYFENHDAINLMKKIVVAGVKQCLDYLDEVHVNEVIENCAEESGSSLVRLMLQSKDCLEAWKI